MMFPGKFRVWDKKERKYYYGKGVAKEKCFPIITPEGDLYDMAHGRFDDGIIKHWLPEWSTGLKDKNGKEIYEGDVVYIAGYGNYTAVFPFHELYDAVMEKDIGSIIGNIHENPELLEENRCEHCGGSNIVTVNVGDEARKKCNDCENFLD